MKYSAQQIAKYILTLSNPEVGDIMSNLKLQKLLYYCQGFHLAMHNEPLFSEQIKAWQYGPVVPEVYHEYKHLGGGAIPVPEKTDEIDPETIELIKEVYNVYGQFSAFKLMEMTHNESPWQSTVMDETIGQDKMTDYFRPLVK